MKANREKFKQFVTEQLKDYDEWREASTDSYAEIIIDEAVKLFCQPAVISWVAVSEKFPTVEDNGQKVLIYRIMNDSQSSLAISIHETNMVKYCNPDETWWMELPKPPCL